ncbi:MAG: transporter substrate-binding domain-containing protein [Oscillospiraceae bacterium]|nr:transporter substrate-binding domain-containing protein [Oscillospiraceae bacterium]MBR0451016.1 transporter substrate-binding domain-containing protein [Oscillospiraceae bacterium]
MKRFIAFLVILVIAFASTGCGSSNNGKNDPNEPVAASDLLARIKERGYIVIATEGNWSPWTFHDDAGKLTGLDVEIGKRLAEELGVDVKFEETDWDSILYGVDTGKYDIACNGVGYTDKRAEKYSFSTPYVYTHKVLVVRADNDSIRSVEDLKGKTTANTASSTYADLAKQYGATVTPVNTLAETIELLDNGTVDATINAQVSINNYLEQNPEANIKIVQVLPGEPVAFPMRKTEDAASLVAAIDEIINDMRSSGELAKISKKFFGMDLTNPD